MKILVTGGAGFIGSHIVDAYIEAGHEVVILDNLSSGRVQNINPNAVFVHADIRDPQVQSVFDDHQIDLVNHQAAQMDVRRSVTDPVFDADNNVLGMLNVLQNCVRTGVKKVIFSSSGGAIYGEQDEFPATETHKTQPYSPYGITKLTGEKYLFFYALAYDLKYTALRYANVYGPRQNPHGEAGVVAIFAQKLLRGEQPMIYGSGEQTRDFVYVRDVVAANMLALNEGDNDVFNVGTSIETSINTIFRNLNELTGNHESEQHAEAKPGEQLRSIIAVQKLKNLGWKPTFDLKSGLQETVEYFKNKEHE